MKKGRWRPISPLLPETRRVDVTPAKISGRLFRVHVGVHGVDRDIRAAIGFGVELHLALDDGKNRVVLADADTVPSAPLGAALTHEDVAGEHVLTAESLHAETATGRVTAVARRAACFLVSHGVIPFLRLRQPWCGAAWRGRPWPLRPFQS